MHWGKGSGRCERQVGLSSTSLLASATRVSHGMRWHQIFNEHAARKEEWCPLGQRAGTLNWSSAAHKCRKRHNQSLKKNKKNKKWLFSTAGGAKCLFNFYFCVSSKKQKSPSMRFLAKLVKVRERMKEQMREE